MTVKEDTKEELLIRAKLAEQADRHDEMAEFMRAYVEKTKKISPEERNLLTFAYKTVVGSRRHSYRVIQDAEQKSQEDTHHKQWMKEYRDRVGSEMRDICGSILSTLEKTLIPNSEEGEAKVFFLKMKADYLRYVAEIADGPDRSSVVEKSRSAYNEALEMAKVKLPATNPIRLGLVLNFSVFHYEIALEKKVACELAKAAFDEALAGLPSVNDDSHKDSTMILQLIRDNLALWTEASVVEGE